MAADFNSSAEDLLAFRDALHVEELAAVVGGDTPFADLAAAVAERGVSVEKAYRGLGDELEEGLGMDMLGLLNGVMAVHADHKVQMAGKRYARLSEGVAAAQELERHARVLLYMSRGPSGFDRACKKAIAAAVDLAAAAVVAAHCAAIEHLELIVGDLDSAIDKADADRKKAARERKKIARRLKAQTGVRTPRQGEVRSAAGANRSAELAAECKLLNARLESLRQQRASRVEAAAALESAIADEPAEPVVRGNPKVMRSALRKWIAASNRSADTILERIGRDVAARRGPWEYPSDEPEEDAAPRQQSLSVLRGVDSFISGGSVGLPRKASDHSRCSADSKSPSLRPRGQSRSSVSAGSSITSGADSSRGRSASPASRTTYAAVAAARGGRPRREGGRGRRPRGDGRGRRPAAGEGRRDGSPSPGRTARGGRGRGRTPVTKRAAGDRPRRSPKAERHRARSREGILALAAAMRDAVGVKDRLHHLRRYRKCFTGAEAVAWLQTRPGIADQAQARAAGTKMMDAGLFCHVTQGCKQLQPHPHAFYRWAVEGQGLSGRAPLPSIGCLVPQPSVDSTSSITPVAALVCSPSFIELAPKRWESGVTITVSSFKDRSRSRPRPVTVDRAADGVAA